MVATTSKSRRARSQALSAPDVLCTETAALLAAAAVLAATAEQAPGHHLGSAAIARQSRKRCDALLTRPFSVFMVSCVPVCCVVVRFTRLSPENGRARLGSERSIGDPDRTTAVNSDADDLHMEFPGQRPAI